MPQYSADIRVGITGKTQLNALEKQLGRISSTITKINKSLKTQTLTINTKGANRTLDQLDKKIDRLMRKIEQGGFVESPPMPEHAPPPSGRKNFLAALAPLLLPLLALVGLFLSLSLSS